MNTFDQIFFKKYTVEWLEIMEVIHKHVIVVCWKIFLNYFFWVVIPSFIYYTSDKIKSFIPFFVFEIFLILMFIKIVYHIFDWYNDVWIITNEWITDLDWTLFNSSNLSIKFENIEWIEIVQDWIMDNLFWKWQIVIQKAWWEELILDDVSRIYKAADELDRISKLSNDEDEEIEDENIWADEQEENHDYPEHYFDQNSPNHNHFHHKNSHSQNNNMDYLLEVLSWVVKEYMWNSWYKKDDSKEKEEKIHEAKKQKWTIDLR